MNFFFCSGFEGVVAVNDVQKRPASLFSIFMTVPQPHRENFKEGSSRMDEDRAGAASGVGQGDKYVMGSRVSNVVPPELFNLASCRGLTNTEIPWIFSLHVVGYSFDSSM